MRWVAINASQGKRIANAVQRTEGQYTPDQRRGRADHWQPGILRAKVTTAISSGTFDSPSSDGEVQIYHLNRSTDTWEASGDPAQVWNQYGESVAVGTAVFVSWISGQWWLNNASCPES
jgi:hypothetical protein